MRYIFYGLASFVEGTLVYILFVLLGKKIGLRLPPLGSPVFIVFLVLWPFLGMVLRPGLSRIPIIGELFSIVGSILGGQSDEKGTDKQELPIYEEHLINYEEVIYDCPRRAGELVCSRETPPLTC